MKTQIYFVLGPTASGKSKFALSLANKLNGEIINADSMQIYHELSILTARPTINDQKKVNHHLYGFVKGDVRFNVQKWCEEASKKIYYLINKNITSFEQIVKSLEKTGRSSLLLKIIRDDEQNWVTIKFKNN